MQPMESPAVRAAARRAFLTTLLTYELNEEDLRTFLNGALDNHATPESRWYAWERISRTHQRINDIETGSASDFNERDADAEAAAADELDTLTRTLDSLLTRACAEVPADAMMPARRAA